MAWIGEGWGEMTRRYWNINLEEMMEVGVHFGHGTRKWNLKMAPYISTKRKVNLQSPINSGLDQLLVNDTSISESSSMHANTEQDMPSSALDQLIVSDTSISESSSMHANTELYKPSSAVKSSTNSEVETKEIKPICSISEPISDYCEIKGDIRIQGSSSTIFVASSNSSISSGNSLWTIRPYARKGNAGAMDHVKEWTVKLVDSQEGMPNCTVNRTTPAILFSLGGYSGNHFHAFSDLVIPLFLTSWEFHGEVNFLGTDYKTWWISKFKHLSDHLTKHPIIDIDREKDIHCYPSVLVGLKCHKELGIDPSKSPNGLSMKNFRQFLRSVYSLNRTTALKMKRGKDEKPRLMIISRKGSRLLLNEGKVTEMARKLGFDVVVAEAKHSTDLSKFAEIVNSCDVLVGVHGAGLTNMVFLPDNAIVIQIVPLGIDWFAKNDFGEPALSMNLRYLDYKISVKESSLIKEYPVDHAVLRNPLSLQKQGWNVIKSTYLDRQNVELNVRRFRATLLKALKFLHH
ncbi:unnamed protein product [Ilex paraguariensis]|uniref:Glycosyltransferase 61 catalytic domain-containing protein n=1 Tax=Ilex paraguariensis TaxID=185542 RepID=A0ABC8RKV6_9AQUA